MGRFQWHYYLFLGFLNVYSIRSCRPRKTQTLGSSFGSTYFERKMAKKKVFFSSLGKCLFFLIAKKCCSHCLKRPQHSIGKCWNLRMDFVWSQSHGNGKNNYIEVKFPINCRVARWPSGFRARRALSSKLGTKSGSFRTATRPFTHFVWIK